MADSLIIQACTDARQWRNDCQLPARTHATWWGHYRSTLCMAPSTTVWPSCGCHCSASTSNIHPGSRACSSTRTYKRL